MIEIAGTTPRTSSAGVTGLRHCAGAPPGLLKADHQFRSVDGRTEHGVVYHIELSTTPIEARTQKEMFARLYQIARTATPFYRRCPWVW
jgi:hypothetical protein